jgi:hypothetical protein
MSLVLLFHYLLPNMFRMLVHPSSGACDLLWIYFMCVLLWFDVCWCYGVIRLGWCGILIQAEALLSASACIRIPHHPAEPPTHIEPEQYNTWNKSTISHKLLKMDVLTFETWWAVNSEIIKQVISNWSILIKCSVVYFPNSIILIFGLWKLYNKIPLFLSSCDWWFLWFIMPTYQHFLQSPLVSEYIK